MDYKKAIVKSVIVGLYSVTVLCVLLAITNNELNEKIIFGLALAGIMFWASLWQWEHLKMEHLRKLIEVLDRYDTIDWEKAEKNGAILTKKEE